MKKIIFDCDNTMGVYEKDVDDGLTLLYLLGRDDVEILGLTTTFGNSTIDIVHENTTSMFKDLGLLNIPLLKGAGAGDDRKSQASKFLLESVKACPGEISILATGSLTNLYGAYLLDSSFFSYVSEIVIMGGVKEPLIINGKRMDELNFSSDAEAAFNVLSKGERVTVLTGHICLQALFGEDSYSRLMNSPSNPVYSYIKDVTLPWFEFIGPKFGIKGFYNWDIVAGVYITNPELFIDSFESISSEVDDLKHGHLEISCRENPGYNLNIPSEIIDTSLFNELVFSAWKNAF